MLKPIDYGIAHAAAWDAGTRSMRAAGREKWGEEDLAAARREFERLMQGEGEEEGKEEQEKCGN